MFKSKSKIMIPRTVHQKIVTEALKSKELGSSCLSLLPSKLAVSSAQASS